MKTPTRKNLFGSSMLPDDLTHATDSYNVSLASRSSNPFYRATILDDDTLAQSSSARNSYDVLNSPSWRKKRSFQREIPTQSSVNSNKRSKMHHCTPVMNGALNEGISLPSGASVWRQHSYLLAKLSEHQQRADKVGVDIGLTYVQTLVDISLLLRDVDKCNMQLKEAFLLH
ncbi:hypothetical protein BBBOND_0107060 [Babesia bigemina]|uniref:Uncharacterized protein n=1 Tax=Babesia bigemina TaxID=5866 RepID=A0A061D2U3_BABBI|nr:hypothetical protein BBBOND_0107060 [Babesia bigemina]CDR94397.1 hypothetical protein BBBOND_0107060 [Babesia bigemina]|eukprot:XP_012766583.1 hypothetical protein BBBOND_0107060 [Babesia bigemina]